MKVKLNDLVPPGEIWFMDTKKIVIAKVLDVNSTHTVSVDITNLHQAVPSWDSSEREIDQFINQLKNNINILLQEKTGWGRVELKRELLNLIDQTRMAGTQSIPDPEEDDLPF